MLEQLFKGFDDAPPPDPDDLDAQIVSGLMQQTYDLGAPRLAAESRTSGRGAKHDALKSFADRYRVEFERNPRRAMTATAEALHMSRATANRWARKCRDVGMLPEAPE
ncbi:hypothetical protein [Microbacterium sp.]|uniref:hypothetical protein n=1 Tax=Microbacterium sp. TaxID=51671 RepID=UPI002603FC9F|nr:hypothetical protein [Microbacterium sp.]